jgi:hypothetical protein
MMSVPSGDGRECVGTGVAVVLNCPMAKGVHVLFCCSLRAELSIAIGRRTCMMTFLVHMFVALPLMVEAIVAGIAFPHGELSATETEVLKKYELNARSQRCGSRIASALEVRNRLVGELEMKEGRTNEGVGGEGATVEEHLCSGPSGLSVHLQLPSLLIRPHQTGRHPRQPALSGKR